MSIQEKFDLTGKTAIVTGGSGLLGAEFSRTLAEAGANIVVADIDEVAAQKIAQGLVDADYSVVSFGLDVTRKESAEEMVAETLKKFGSLDILVNSAALDPKFDATASTKGIAPGAFEDYPLEDFKAAVDVNLTGMFIVTQACVKPMVAQGKKGSIINICSTYGLNGPDQRLYLNDDGSRVAFKPVYYTTTKAGVVGFTKYLAAYYTETDIRVNALTPGGVFNDHNDTFNRKYSEKTIMGRMAKLDEMNGALLYLASAASSYMTGSNVVVDGGWTAW
ncbi:MAG: SDR family oxidoreductase [Anaerolineae bacterium]|jgi:NAD(P)-dependent dehydrogenase (short-subunit alcohol dehydrogenase family)|nr:SDR family oxidoreductase [Anaerolineae bacterium]MBT7074891.1 SDR family oxidoreductase [Anaerolineae bacterium]MBT7781826.1 SDR family oxidoreductase [Anaerolineae bacterium]